MYNDVGLHTKRFPSPYNHHTIGPSLQPCSTNGAEVVRKSSYVLIIVTVELFIAMIAGIALGDEGELGQS